MAPGRPVALGCLILVGGERPVWQGVEPALQKALTVVLMVEVTGVLPQVADEQGGGARLAEDIIGVMGGADIESPC